MKLIVNITSIMLLILSASGSIEAQSQSSNRGSRPARLGKIEIVDKVLWNVSMNILITTLFDETRIVD